jgi:hypothetical protein
MLITSTLTNCMGQFRPVLGLLISIPICRYRLGAALVDETYEHTGPDKRGNVRATLVRVWPTLRLAVPEGHNTT